MLPGNLLPPKLSALLIDYDNAAGLFPKAQFVQRMSNWLSWLQDGRFDPTGRRRKFIEKRVYWHPTNGNQQPAFELHKFICETCQYESGPKRGMSAVDINLAMDAIDLAHRRKGSLQEIVILASDSDYVSLIDRLRRKNIRTCIVVSTRDASIVSYTGRADLVIPDEKLAEAADYIRGRKQASAPSSRAQSNGAELRQTKPAAPSPVNTGDAIPISSAPRKRRRRAVTPTSPGLVAADIELLAKIVEDIAIEHGGPVGQDKIMLRLNGKPGFPRSGWSGFSTYREFAEAVVKLRPQLGMIVYRGGRSVSIYKKRKQSGGGEAKTA